MFNSEKLRDKMRENDVPISKVLANLGINKSTFYRKMNSGGFTISEASKLVEVVGLTKSDAVSIFLAQ